MTTARIDARFAALKAEGRAGFVAYVMAGDPSRDEALEILRGLPAAGADIIELGFPFSDPMAEGPPIQRAAQRGLKAGLTLKGTLALAAAFREGDADTPVILMGYLNPIETHGYDAFARDAAASGHRRPDRRRLSAGRGRSPVGRAGRQWGVADPPGHPDLGRRPAEGHRPPHLGLRLLRLRRRGDRGEGGAGRLRRPRRGAGPQGLGPAGRRRLRGQDAGTGRRDRPRRRRRGGRLGSGRGGRRPSQRTNRRSARSGEGEGPRRRRTGARVGETV
jgi:hypothetical protein